MENKKIKRWESKKRKVEAFLELTKDNPLVKMQEESTIPCKQAKTDSDDGDSSDQDTEQKLQGELEKLRAEIKARQKAMMQKPKVYLTLENLQVPSQQPQAFAICPQPTAEPRYLPLFIMDLQHLILYATQGNIASFKPRWCKLLRVGKVSHVILLVLNEVSVKEYNSYPQCFPYIKSAFEMKTEMISPTEYGSSVYEELFTVPVSVNQTKRQVRDLTWIQTKKTKVKPDTPEGHKAKVDKQSDDKKSKTSNAASSTESMVIPSIPLPLDDEFNRVHLLLSPQQMIQEDYPLPVNAEKTPGYTYSNLHYADVKTDSPMYAVDCEMCMTVKGALELTRVSIVDEKLEVVYDTLVKPYNKIINYLTRYSGITKDLLKNVTTRIEHVHETIQKILPADAILCGQSLNGDLHALKLYHPYVIDTSVIYNLTGIRGMKPGLKRLAAHFLQKEIQTGKKGHSPVEDATTTMELVNLKLSKGHTFGDVILSGPVRLSMGEEQPTVSEKLDLELASNLIQSNKDSVTLPSKKNNEEVTEFKPCKGCRNCDPPTDGVKVKGDSSDSELSDSEEPKRIKLDTKECTNCSSQQTSEKNMSKDSPKSTNSSTSNSEKGNLDNNKSTVSDSNTSKNTKIDDSENSSSMSSNSNIESDRSKNFSDSSKNKVESGSSSSDKGLNNAEKSGVMSAKAMFFRRPDTKYSRNFFHLTKESKKSVLLIGNGQEFCEKSLADDKNSMVTHTVTSNDKKTAKQCTKALCRNFLTMASFNDFAFNTVEEKQQEKLRKLDERVETVLLDAPANSLVTVLLGGRTEGVDSHKALCFVKIV